MPKPGSLIACPRCGTPISLRFALHSCKPKSVCSHKDRKVVIAAKYLLIKCVRCKEVIHQRRRVLSSSVYALARLDSKPPRHWKGKEIMNLEVQYLGKAGGYGKVYVYYNVPAFHYDKALRAKSIGGYIAEIIKPNFEFAEVK